MALFWAAAGVADEVAPRADDTAPTAAEPATDDRAATILAGALRHLEGLPAFRIRASSIFDVVQESGEKLQFGAEHDVTLRRPDRARATHTRDDGLVRRVWYSGGQLTTFDEEANVYGQVRVPPTIDETLDYAELELGAPLPLADVFYSDISHLETLAVGSSYVGESYLEGVGCHHLAFIGDAVDWQIWVQREGDPLLRKIVITYKEIEGAPQFAARFHEWDAKPRAADSDFVFEPPKGVQKIPTIALPRRGRLEEMQLEGLEP